MQPNARAPKKISGPNKTCGSTFIKETHFNIALRILRINYLAVFIDKARNPIKRMQIAQAAFTLFDIGLNHIAGIAFTLMTGIPFREFRGNISTAFALGYVLTKFSIKLISESLIPAQKS